MNLPQVKTENIVVQYHEAEVLIYDLKINKAYCLNETAAIVYQNCDDTTTIADLKKRFQLTDELIFLALDKLRDENLLADNAEYQSPLANINRREAIRRAGLASLAALPLISVIVAPQASYAASTFAPGSRTLRQSCGSSVHCAPGAPNCTETPFNSGRKVCCVGDVSYYDTGEEVGSCSGGTCSEQTFTCQSDANRYCCSGSSYVSCSSPNSCACLCN